MKQWKRRKITQKRHWKPLGEGYVRFALNKTVEEIQEIIKTVAEGGVL